ncbi:toluene tolerance protein Ttg2E [Pseudomonas putida S11]|nr:toluene tolerance protein Ttg2E [Pseudomonas putida S11]
MSEAGVSMAEPGVLRLAGVLDYRSGPVLRKQGKALIAACREAQLVLDCSAVQRSTSVGLSLLLALHARCPGRRQGLPGAQHARRHAGNCRGL